ncbi:hypothetical protein MYA98_25930 [Salmonella sp. WGH-01]|nr:hypothetical protein MYA98_25930 [Salmonella sp. WGH-01]
MIFMTQTFIPGKDAALEDSIARFQQKLLDLGFHIEEASAEPGAKRLVSAYSR